MFDDVECLSQEVRSVVVNAEVRGSDDIGGDALFDHIIDNINLSVSYTTVSMAASELTLLLKDRKLVGYA